MDDELGPCAQHPAGADASPDRPSDGIGAQTDPVLAQTGFSLIELLVATAVLAVLSTGAMLALRPGGNATDNDMRRLETVFQGQRALAIEGHDRRGLRLGPRSAQVVAWRQGAWQAQGPDLMFRRAIQIDVGRVDDAPQIVIEPDGRSTAFTLLLADGARCETDGWAALTCAR